MIKLPKIRLNYILAVAAVGLSVAFPSIAPFITTFSQSFQDQSFNSETFNITHDPTTKQMRFGCSHQL